MENVGCSNKYYKKRKFSSSVFFQLGLKPQKAGNHKDWTKQAQAALEGSWGLAGDSEDPATVSRLQFC